MDLIGAVHNGSSPVSQTGRSRLYPTPTSSTPRKREVMALGAAGLSNDDEVVVVVVASLFVSPLTAKTHVGRIRTELGARDRTQLVVLAYGD